MDGLIEFLEVPSDETPQSILSPVRTIQLHLMFIVSLSPQWELVAGGHYEPILTTRDGLWRYRIRDVVVVKGFAPDDGLPVISYVGRQE